MTVQEKTRWKNWAEGLRQEMMTGLQPQVTKSLASIISETATSKAESTLRSRRFWKACQEGKSPNDTLSVAGFEIDYELDDDNNVSNVTFQLNSTWMSILTPVIERTK